MAATFEILKRAGRIPLNELVVRSSEPAETVTKTVNELLERGLVRVLGNMPETPQQAHISADTVVELTSQGFSKAV